MAKPGHNNPPADIDGVLVEPLRQYIERIENLMEEKKNLQDDIKEVFAEAKASGYDVKTMRQIIRLRAMDANDRAEAESLLEIYKNALGMLADTPLGQAACGKAV